MEQSRVVVIFYEGDTDGLFYREAISIIRNKLKSALPCSVEYVNMKGIGNYQAKAQRIFENDIKHKHAGANFDILLCYDTDAFEFSSVPPINRKDVKTALRREGASKVLEVKARKSIEDWFMLDIEGVLRYLHLPSKTKPPSKTGYNQLKELFKKVDKVYTKGMQGEKFIQALNVEKIMCTCCKELRSLCSILGYKCQLIKLNVKEY